MLALGLAVVRPDHDRTYVVRTYYHQDIPFIKLLNGTRLGVERGWFHEAVNQLKSPSGKTYYMQCTTWRDKKQVFFLNNCDVRSSIRLSAMCHMKGKKYVSALEDQDREHNMPNISMRWIRMIGTAPTTQQASVQIDITFEYYVGSRIEWFMLFLMW